MWADECVRDYDDDDDGNGNDDGMFFSLQPSATVDWPQCGQASNRRQVKVAPNSNGARLRFENS